jgi:hypothetical protein
MRNLGIPISAVAALAVFGISTLWVSSAHAQPVALQNATATFSQGVLGGGPYSPDMAIDGLFDDKGWTIDHFPNNNPAEEFTRDETAVFETVSDLGPSILTFTMHFLHWNPPHLLGRFRLSVTTDDRSAFADGLREGGDVTANWTVLTNPVVQGPAGMTFTTLSDNSVLAGGTVPGQGVYEVSAVANLSGITGVRLDVLKDPSLSADGPGFAANGNFVLTELVVTAAPITGVSGPVAIDIQPGRDLACLNNSPVAILGSADFDVTNINADTLMYGELPVEPRGGPGRRCSIYDINSDGFLDLICQFVAGSADATVHGEFYDGTPFEGTDSICVVR